MLLPRILCLLFNNYKDREVYIYTEADNARNHTILIDGINTLLLNREKG